MKKKDITINTINEAIDARVCAEMACMGLADNQELRPLMTLDGKYLVPMSTPQILKPIRFKVGGMIQVLDEIKRLREKSVRDLSQ